MRVVLLQAATLPSEYKEGKLQAFRLLCAMMSRRQDLLPNSDFLVHFYFVLRLGLTSEDQVGALLRVPLLRAYPSGCSLCRGKRELLPKPAAAGRGSCLRSPVLGWPQE